ncbi:MAG: hypothetical protein C5B60_09935 [Chloroflexi bacterium]|nr:MAG: hypothetical protein C5B60_09935 [Chloroflexota bacterium]
MTKREKELQLLRNQIRRLENRRETAIRDLVTATTKLPGLRKQEARLTTALLRRLPRPSISEEEVRKAEAAVQAAAPEVTQTATSKDDGLDIPEWMLRNRQLQTLPDPKTKEKKAERKAIEAEMRQAELTGKRRKMPLSGKDALAAIRKNG